jgi:general secretion pathway protein I
MIVMQAKQRGFSLLEIMIALAILAFALIALLGHQGVMIQASDFSNRVSQAVFLLESKLLDVKHKILSESVDVYDNCEDGDFKDEGFRGRFSNQYEWKVCAFKLEIQEGASEQLTERLMGLLSGSSGEGENGMMNGVGGLNATQLGGLDPAAGMEQAMGQIAMASGMIPTFLQQLEDQIRKVRIEVSWRDQTQTHKVVIERFVTSLGSDSAGGEAPPEDSLANENKNKMEQDMIDNGATLPGAQGGR